MMFIRHNNNFYFDVADQSKRKLEIFGVSYRNFTDLASVCLHAIKTIVSKPHILYNIKCRQSIYEGGGIKRGEGGATVFIKCQALNNCNR